MGTEGLYYSNDGRGLGIARVIAVYEDRVWMERKSNAKSRHWVSFELSRKFFESNKCGWKKRQRI